MLVMKCIPHADRNLHFCLHCSSEPLGIQELKAWLTDNAVQQHTAAAAQQQQQSEQEKPFLFAIDHCFPVKGQGTVMTGTVLQVCYMLLTDMSLTVTFRRLYFLTHMLPAFDDMVLCSISLQKIVFCFQV